MAAQFRRPRALFRPFQVVEVAAEPQGTQVFRVSQAFLATILAQADSRVLVVTRDFQAIQDLASQATRVLVYRVIQDFQGLVCQAIPDFLDCQGFLGCRAFQVYRDIQDRESLVTLDRAYLVTRAFQVLAYQDSQV